MPHRERKWPSQSKLPTEACAWGAVPPDARELGCGQSGKKRLRDLVMAKGSGKHGKDASEKYSEHQSPEWYFTC